MGSRILPFSAVVVLCGRTGCRDTRDSVGVGLAVAWGWADLTPCSAVRVEVPRLRAAWLGRRAAAAVPEVAVWRMPGTWTGDTVVVTAVVPAAAVGAVVTRAVPAGVVQVVVTAVAAAATGVGTAVREVCSFGELYRGGLIRGIWMTGRKIGILGGQDRPKTGVAQIRGVQGWGHGETLSIMMVGDRSMFVEEVRALGERGRPLLNPSLVIISVIPVKEDVGKNISMRRTSAADGVGQRGRFVE